MNKTKTQPKSSHKPRQGGTVIKPKPKASKPTSETANETDKA